MSIKQQAEELTKAYIVSYNMAMKEVKNPELAVQIAGAVVTAINGTLPKQNVEINSFAELIAHECEVIGNIFDNSGFLEK